MLTISILTSLLLFIPQEFIGLYHYQQSQSHEDAHMDTVHAQGRSTYDVHIEIDIDCEELVDACGLDYTRSEDDDTQNVIIISLSKEEAADVLDQSVLSMTNEQTLGTAILNPELGEYVTKVTVYTPHGDKITFE